MTARKKAIRDSVGATAALAPPGMSHFSSAPRCPARHERRTRFPAVGQQPIFPSEVATPTCRILLTRVLQGESPSSTVTDSRRKQYCCACIMLASGNYRAI